MIELKRKEDCLGCTACQQICPKKCITMRQDEEGFSYPEINKDVCINCNLCNNTCPKINNSLKPCDQNVYAVQSKNFNNRKTSSSGGVFPLLANIIIKQNGVVYGCTNKSDVAHPHHIRISSLADLPLLKGSIYVQSDLGNTFSYIKKDLIEGRKVLFSGTPCQCSGLRSFLRKEYDNLYIVDLLCHGVPSPKLYKENLEIFEDKFQSKVASLNLRSKEKSWKRLFTKIEFENGKRYFKFSGYDPYMSLFLNNKSQRPSCFECPFTQHDRIGDITLGDFWGIANHIREMDDDKGTSMVITNNLKGRNLFSSIEDELKYVETTIEIAESGNKVLCEPAKKNKDRDNFYKEYELNGLTSAYKKYSNVPGTLGQIKGNFLKFGIDIYRKIFRKTY